ncbi:hypothetical protein [Lactiplantibacillus plantarum]|uniref:hypothetical protein n=1 Tax=Lactiplantibacillus plantarum TaxID=1590 RepID=UPI0021A7C228|nr:hypothetical protein [Lactiplantibacillus plantarum]MCT4450566.1 hypothetical protein [Lactiplantibacillus plantarum]MCT4459651.1 hypothetical protein [Lactiplantibacillus plantarum]
MQKSRGIIVGLLLTGLLTGCHSATDTQTPTVQPATSKVSAVRSVTTRDFLGRWVSARPAMSLYLSTNHQVAWFRRGHTPIRSRATLALSDTRATFTIDHNVAKLTLNDANQMTMNYQGTNIALIKDPNWQPEHNQVPTTTNDALKAGTLTPTFKLSY